MASDDPVDTETPVFTEEEVFMISAYVAEFCGFDDEPEVVYATKQAIKDVLGRAEKP